MQFEFTEEQKLIASMVEEFARSEGASEKVRAAMATDTGFLPETWQTLAVELGLCGLLVPEASGGQGLGMVEAAVVFEQLGKTLLPSPLLTTAVLGVSVLKALSQSAALEKIAAGEHKVTVACLDGGRAEFVPDASAADRLILWDRQSAVLSLVANGSEGLQIEAVPTLDQTRRLAHVSVADSGVLTRHRIASGDAAAAAVQGAHDLARIALGAEAAGAAETCLARTVEYAGERVQFGRAIGSFQAVKHQLADMMVSVEAAISAVYLAACAASEDTADLRQMAALAKVQASEAFSFCAGRMIQLHGGIGFTWEHDGHLYFKRARATASLFGSNADLDESIASSIGLEDCA